MTYIIIYKRSGEKFQILDYFFDLEEAKSQLFDKVRETLMEDNPEYSYELKDSSKQLIYEIAEKKGFYNSKEKKWIKQDSNDDLEELEEIDEILSDSKYYNEDVIFSNMECPIEYDEYLESISSEERQLSEDLVKPNYVHKYKKGDLIYFLDDFSYFHIEEISDKDLGSNDYDDIITYRYYRDEEMKHYYNKLKRQKVKYFLNYQERKDYYIKLKKENNWNYK